MLNTRARTRSLVPVIVALVAPFAGFACGGSEGLTEPVPPTPLVVALAGPTSAAGVVTQGLGACTYSLSAAATGGNVGAVAQWEGATLTYTGLVSQAAVTEELNAAQVAALFTTPTVAVGQSITAQRVVSRDRAFRVRHDLRYRADGVTKSAAHELRCEFPPVAAVVVTPSATASLRAGETLQLAATPRDSAGAALTGRLVAWTSSAASVATVSTTGLVTAVGAGTATLTGTSEGMSATTAVNVLAAVASVTVTPPAVHVSPGYSAPLTVVLRDARNAVLTGRVVTYTSGGSSFVTVSSTGVVTGVSPWSGSVDVSSEGVTTRINAVVGPRVATLTPIPAAATVVVGGSVQLSATPYDAGGGVLLWRYVMWSSADTTVATVGPDGIARGRRAGTVAITASSEGRSITVPVTVVVPVASVAVTPAIVSVGVGANTALAAATLDSAGTPLASRSVTWTTNTATIATVSSAGVVTGIASGSATITATSEGRSGTARVDVGAALATLSIAPDPAALAVGQSLALTVTARDAGGNVLVGRRIGWSIADATLALIDSTGVVRGLRTGTTTITASAEGRSASLLLRVVAPVATITVAANPASVQVGDFTTLVATPRDASGTVLTGRVVSWTSADVAIATVNDSGRVTGVAVGATTVSAASEGRTTVVPVTVATRQPAAALVLTPSTALVPMAGSTQLVAQLRDAAGAPLEGRTITFSSSTPSIATVSANGLVTGVALGTATITATGDGRSATAAITVVKPVATIVLTPSSATIYLGATTTLSANLRDDTGAALTGRAIVFMSSDTTIARVSAAGVVTAVTVGTATITAQSEGRVATSSINSIAAVGAVTVTPSPARVSLGGTTALAATLLDVEQRVVTGRTVSWTTSSAAIATVSASGVVSGVALGTATITATSEGRSGTATVNVTAPVATVTVTTSATSFPVGGTVQLVATARDAGSVVLAGTTAAWSSSAPSVASVTPQGLVALLAPGTATITASIEGRSGTIVINAVQVVSRITVAPGSVRAAVDAVIPLVATLFDASGATIAGRTVTWRSDNPTIATVSAAGTLTTVAIGTTTVIAESGGVTGSAAVTVYDPVLFVSIDPISVQLTTGARDTTLSAVPYGSQGIPLTGRGAPVWSSSDPAVATVSASGTVRAVGVGLARMVAAIEDSYGTSVVEVQQGPFTTVSVSPATVRLLMRRDTLVRAIARDALGQPAAAPAAAWTSSDPTIVIVNQSGQLFGQGRAGTAVIRATIDGKFGESTITVPPLGPAVLVSFFEPTKTLIVGQKGFGSPVALDANGVNLTSVSSPTFTFATSNAAVAAVAENGEITAVSAGTATITATLDGRSGQLAVTVVPSSAPGTLVLSPASASLLVGSTLALRIEYRDAAGTQMFISGSSSFTSSDPTRATVTSNGTVTGLAAGPVTVTLTAMGLTARTTLTIGRVPVTSVTTSPRFATLLPGQTIQLSAVVMNSSTVLTDRIVQWGAPDPAIATVSATGLVTARALGNASVFAVSEGSSNFANIYVVSSLPPVGRVIVAPGELRFDSPGQTAQFTATVTGVDGAQLLGRLPTWASTNPTVATVTSAGLVTSGATGVAGIVATVDGRADTAWAYVNTRRIASIQIVGYSSMRIGESAYFQPLLYDEGGRVLDAQSRSFTWRSTNPSVASVTNAGLVTARAPGITELFAYAEGLVSNPAAQTVVLAQSDSVASVGITPATSTIVVDSVLQLYGSYVTESGERVEGRGITWASSDPSIASVPASGGLGPYARPSGPVTGLRPGTVTITATVGGRSATAQVTVRAPSPVASIIASPNPATFTVSVGGYITPTLFDAAGAVLQNRVISFASSNPNVAPVDGNGYVGALAVGTATVTVTSEGRSTTVGVTIVASQPTVATVVVTPNPASVARGSSVQLSATLRDAGGAVLTGRAISWTSSTPSIATVSASGLVSGLVAGTSTITASSGGQSGNSVVTVTSSSTGGNVCSAMLQATPPAPGSSTGWMTTPFRSLDFMLSTSSTSTGGKYPHTVRFRNRYTQEIHLAVGGPLATQPTAVATTNAVAAGGTGGSHTTYLTLTSRVYVLLSSVRFGTFAPAYCE